VGLGRRAFAGLPAERRLQAFLEATQPFFKDIKEMTHYQVTANGLDGPGDWSSSG
jgi:hypothetical protein